MHDLGIILWYREIPGLKEKVILRPEWATKAVYLIIDDELIQKKEGSFGLSDIQRLWNAPGYKQMQQELLALMTEFKLCFQKKNKPSYLIPSLLPAEPKHKLTWNKDRNLVLQFEYEFMPKGIANQLAAHLHKYLKGEGFIWGRGMWLTDQGTDALIEEDWAKRTISIRATGINPSGMMKMIVSEMEDINDTYPGIEVTKKVPCICSSCISANEPELFDHQKLLEKVYAGKDQYYCNKGDSFVDIGQILFRVGIYNSSRVPVGFFNLQREKNFSLDKTEGEFHGEFQLDQANSIKVNQSNQVIEKIISSCKELIGQGRMLDALKELENMCKSAPLQEFENDVISKKGRFNRISKKNNDGLLAQDEHDRLLNKLTKSILALIDEIEEEIN